MATFVAACRLSSRLAARQLRHDVSSRGYRTSSACLAAQNFTMPALSPTMTEGNISSWKVKEGEAFSAGDVLLEIETDKASMDVEAQEDGIMAKITQGDGSKGVKVGSRIAVIAEAGDDVSTLEIPAEEAVPAPKEAAAEPDPPKESKEEAAPTPKPSSSSSSSAPSKPQTRPLLPSVEHLMHLNGLDASAVEKMTPTGPNNRLLKGDVLAYLGMISSSYPGELASKISKLSHLDLSNIKMAAPAAKKPEAAPAPIPEAVVEELEVALPISMAAVIEVQKRIKTTLGVTLPLATFIARAADVANDDLPKSKVAKPSADELFNEVLGLSKIGSAGSRGNFVPQIFALPASAMATKPRIAPSPKPVDIIDILAGKSMSMPKLVAATPLLGSAATTNIFSVSVPAGDEKRAQVFLERVKTVLEVEPGRLVV